MIPQSFTSSIRYKKTIVFVPTVKKLTRNFPNFPDFFPKKRINSKSTMTILCPLTCPVVANHTLSHVLFQCRVHGERHVTDVAVKGLLEEIGIKYREREREREREKERERITNLSLLSVCSHMPGELTALGARVWAKLAFVRLFPRMRTQMNDQIGAIGEHLNCK